MPRKTQGPTDDGPEPVDASMRPRPDAAENEAQEERLGLDLAASMRPRPDAAENGRRRRAPAGTRSRFNEAAARCRGKHSTAAAWVAAVTALQ